MAQEYQRLKKAYDEMIKMLDCTRSKTEDEGMSSEQDERREMASMILSPKAGRCSMISNRRSWR